MSLLRLEESVTDLLHGAYRVKASMENGLHVVLLRHETQVVKITQYSVEFTDETTLRLFEFSHVVEFIYEEMYVVISQG